MNNENQIKIAILRNDLDHLLEPSIVYMSMSIDEKMIVESKIITKKSCPGIKQLTVMWNEEIYSPRPGARAEK